MDDSERYRHHQAGVNFFARYHPTVKLKKKAQVQANKASEKKTQPDKCSVDFPVTVGRSSSESSESIIDSHDSPEVDESSSLMTDYIREHSYEEKISIGSPSLNIHPTLQQVLRTKQFETLKEVQLTVFSYFKEKYADKNLVICASNKSGRTTAVIMAFVNEILTEKHKNMQALVLCPTFELAEACYSFASLVTERCSLKVCLAVKGKKSLGTQKITEDLIIATPDKIKTIEDCMDFKKIGYFFIDDVDCLNNPKNYLKVFNWIRDKLSSKCRAVISTVSVTEDLKEFIKTFETYPGCIKIKEGFNKTNINECFILYENINDKVDAIVHLHNCKSYIGQTVILCETRVAVSKLEELLKEKDIKAVKLTGGKDGLSLSERTNIIERFNNNQIEVLVTTRTFHSVISSCRVTKLINAEIIFGKDRQLDYNEYNRRKYLVSGRKNCFIANFIDGKFGKYLFGKDISISETSNIDQSTGKESIEIYNRMEIITVKRFIATF